MAQIISRESLPFDAFAWELEGFRYGTTNTSVIFVEAQPGDGPKLHSHPYEEIFIVQEGQVTFTLGAETIEATAGMILMAPAGTPHKFINSGTGILRQIDIHASARFITTWYDDLPAAQPD